MIVTRFAPSPTGYLHIGGARTALFCWLLARHEGPQGRMILRIEDTDTRRNTPTATQQVMADLQWLGIDWDEGPDPDGFDPANPVAQKGENGPYLQSQRLHIYERYVDKLLLEGKAYYCFDTPDEIATLRAQAVAAKRTFAYPRPDCFATEDEANEARAAGRPVTVRFAMPDQDIVVSDEVRGDVTFGRKELSDFIIVKSDGYPTYHFACVVDDELMGVTHVVRGQEHLMNTPGHVALQRALGFRTPVYAHMSVTVSEGGGKLSKRDRAKTLLAAIAQRKGSVDLDDLAVAAEITRTELNAFLAGESTPDGPSITAMAEHLGVVLPEINVVDFFHSGYLPEAMVNFIALLGWSPGREGSEVMTRQELIDSFDIRRLNKTNSLFDRQKLMALNMEHYRRLVQEDLPRLRGHFRQFLKARQSRLAQLNDEVMDRLLAINEGARTLAQVEEKCLFLVMGDDEYEYNAKAVKKVLAKADAPELLSAARDALAETPQWSADEIHKAIDELCAAREVGMGKVAQPIRVAITGTTISPPIGDSLELLGRDRTLKRIGRTLDMLAL